MLTDMPNCHCFSVSAHHLGAVIDLDLQVMNAATIMYRKIWRSSARQNASHREAHCILTKARTSTSDHIDPMVLFAAKRAARNTARNTARIVTPAMSAPIDVTSGYALTQLDCPTMKPPFAWRKMLYAKKSGLNPEQIVDVRVYTNSETDRWKCSGDERCACV